ncbi:MAG TPA: aminodeoxychorismate synthase component I [Dermatophilaceae bacterium]|nr:aminodeoxychorismate synthase component I [Dermatophilaceae bacterium]
MEAYVDLPWAPPGESGSLHFGEPDEVVRADRIEDVRPALARVVEASRSGCYAVGFVSYEAAPAFDPAMLVRSGSGMPLVWFGLHHAPAAGPRRDPAAYLMSRWEPGTDEHAYAASIAAVRAAIARGDSYQVNHTMRLRGRFAGDPLGAWRDLCRRQGSGWFGYLDTGEHAVLSSSPELFFTWDGHEVVTRPMKGTRRRGTTPVEDAGLRADLLSSPKDRAENLMIVDLLRNDIARVCEPGTVAVPSLFDVEGHPTVWQMTSTVTGRGRAGLDVLGIFDALFPCGSITGAPKVRTMELIAELEDRPRGVYCGAVGLVYPGGPAAFNVAIRTLVVGADGRARYDVGGGVVWDSDGADEYAEALAKAAVLDALAPDCRLIETMRHDGQSVCRLPRHLARLAESAAWLGWEVDLEEVRQRLESLSSAPARVRLTVGPTGDVEVTSSPLPEPFSEPAPVALADSPVWSSDPTLHYKTTRRAVYDDALARARAAYGPVFDVILHNEWGEVTELTIGNLVADLDGTLVTSPLTAGLLPGVMRAELLRLGTVVEGALTLADLHRADRLWLVNSVREWVPLRLVVHAGGSTGGRT